MSTAVPKSYEISFARDALPSDQYHTWNVFKNLYLDKTASENQSTTIQQIAEGKPYKSTIFKDYHSSKQLKLFEELIFGNDSLDEFLRKKLRIEDGTSLLNNNLSKDSRYTALIQQLSYVCEAISNYNNNENERSTRRHLIANIEERLGQKWIEFRDSVQPQMEKIVKERMASLEDNDRLAEYDSKIDRYESQRRVRYAIQNLPSGKLAHTCFSGIYLYTNGTHASESKNYFKRLCDIYKVNFEDIISYYCPKAIDCILQSTMFTHLSNDYLSAPQRPAKEGYNTQASFTTHYISNLKTGLVSNIRNTLRAERGLARNLNSIRNIKNLSLDDFKDGEAIGTWTGLLNSRELSSRELEMHYELRSQIRSALAKLEEREATILKLRYGLRDPNDELEQYNHLCNDYGVLTTKDIGRILNLSQQRVVQIENDALKRIRSCISPATTLKIDTNIIPFRDLFRISDGEEILIEPYVDYVPYEALQVAQTELCAALGQDTFKQNAEAIHKSPAISVMLLRGDGILSTPSDQSKSIRKCRQNINDFLEQQLASPERIQKANLAMDVIEYIHLHRMALRIEKTKAKKAEPSIAIAK